MSSMSSASVASPYAALPLCLPPPLLTLVLQCLPLSQKCTECTRLCRAFPRLDSAHFIFDAIDLQPHVMAALVASPSLLDLLSSIPCVLLQDTDRAAAARQAQAQQSRVRHQPSKQPWFPRAQRVALTGMIEHTPFELLHSMLVPQPQSPNTPTEAATALSLPPPPPPASVRLPWIHTLRLSVVEQSEPMEHTAASLQPLALLPLLRTVVIDELEGGLDYAAFRFLCSLPLDHLDLHGVHVTPAAPHAADAVGSKHEASAEQPPVTDTWRVLRLPTFDPAVWLTDAMLNALLEPYVGRASSSAGLRYISLVTPQPTPAFRRLAAVRSLQSLDMRLQPRLGVPNDSGALPVSPFFSPPAWVCTSAAWPVVALPSLPHLRHLRLRNNLPARSDAPPNAGGDGRVTLVTPYIDLLTAYSRQLRVLSLSRLYPWDRREGLWEALGRCSQLRVFELNGSLGARVEECNPPVLQPQLPCLPHLHTLRFRVPVHTLDILKVVKACPALQDYRQTGPFPLPLDVLREMGGLCKHLRRLECAVEAEDCEASATATVAQLQSASTPSSLSNSHSGVLFPRLTSLIIHAERRPSVPSLSPPVHPQAATMPAAPAVAVFPFAQAPIVAGLAQPPSGGSMQPASSQSASISTPAPSASSPPTFTPAVPVQPERTLHQKTATSGATPRLSDFTVYELAAVIGHSPVRYLDAPGVPLLSVRRFATLTQLRALRCQQSHLQHAQPSPVYIPADNLMPRVLQRYFVAQATPPQPSTCEQTDKALLTSDLIDDERPVADWQLDEDARGTAWAPSCQRFVSERRFDSGMDGREAFMAAVREMAEAGCEREDGEDEVAVGQKRRGTEEPVTQPVRKRAVADGAVAKEAEEAVNECNGV